MFGKLAFVQFRIILGIHSKNGKVHDHIYQVGEKTKLSFRVFATSSRSGEFIERSGSSQPADKMCEC